jgi:hypothetical protein
MFWAYHSAPSSGVRLSKKKARDLKCGFFFTGKGICRVRYPGSATLASRVHEV